MPKQKTLVRRKYLGLDPDPFTVSPYNYSYQTTYNPYHWSPFCYYPQSSQPYIANPMNYSRSTNIPTYPLSFNQPASSFYSHYSLPSQPSIIYPSQYPSHPPASLSFPPTISTYPPPFYPFPPTLYPTPTAYSRVIP